MATQAQPEEKVVTEPNQVVTDALQPETATTTAAATPLKTSFDEKHFEKEGLQGLPGPIDESAILEGRQLWIVWIAFLLSILLIALDQTIVATALPKLASQFNALDQLTWIVSSYFLTQAGLILTFGQLLTIVPTKWIYLIVIGIFELGSLICGVAPSMEVLIFGRAVQGVGAAGIFTSILSAVGQMTRLEQRPVLFGSLGGVFAFASVVGPLLGGVFTDKVSWRWCFYINLPFGAISIVAIAYLLPSRPPAPDPSLEGLTTLQKWLKLDWFGSVVSLAMITCFLLPLQWGGNTREWNDRLVIALFAAFGALLIIFLAWEWYMGDRAIVPLKMFKSRTQTGACIEIFFIFVSFLVAIYYLPFYYQAKGASAVRSGIEIIPFSMLTVFGTAVSAAIIGKTGRYKPLLIIGPPLASIAGGLLTTIDMDTSRAKLVGYQVIFGFGCGLAFQVTILAIQAEYAPQPELIPRASALASFLQLVGGTVGIAIAGALFANQLTKEIHAQAPDLPDELVKAVRQSVTVIFTLEPSMRDSVVKAYVDSLATTFTMTIPALILAGVAGILVRDWNLKERGGAGGAAVA